MTKSRPSSIRAAANVSAALHAKGKKILSQDRDPLRRDKKRKLGQQ
jgi:hypothetical protein